MAARSAQAEALLLAAGLDGDRTRMDDALDYAWSVRKTNGTTGHPGLGLSTGYDAFGDATTNPSSTIYTATTYTLIAAYLAAWDAFGDQAYMDKVALIIPTFDVDLWGYVSGARMATWYSDNANDHVDLTMVVNNTASHGLYAFSAVDRRLATATYATKRAGISQLLRDYRTVGVTVAAGYNPQGWTYGANGTRGNDDQGHEANTIMGLIEAGAAGDSAARAAALAAATGQWPAHFLYDGTPRVAVSTGGVTNAPWTSLTVFSRLSELAVQASRVAANLAAQVGGDGSIPAAYVDPSNDYSWSAVSLAWGLAHYARYVT